MNPNTLVKTKSRICFTFHKSQHPFPKFSFSTSNIFFFLFSKLNCRYLWNIHWEIMDFIHPRFFSLLDLCFSRSTKHRSRWWFNHGQDLGGVNGSRKVRMILAWFGERKSGGAVERGRNEL